MRKIRIVAAVVILAALPLTAAARRRTTPLASKSEAKTYAVSKAYLTSVSSAFLVRAGAAIR